MREIVFIHGLNTYGDDDLRIGPLRFGLMHARVEQELAKRGVKVFCATGFGSGSPEEQAQGVLRSLGERATSELCLIGQSVGGLVARVLASVPYGLNVQKIITIGTPHRGAKPASVGLEFPTRYPLLTRAAGLAGYDPRTRSQIYSCLTGEALADFAHRYPVKTNVQEYSLLCEVPRSEVSWPYQFLYGHVHPRNESGERVRSDGFIWSESQLWGKTFGPFQLDHYGAIGFFPFLNPRRRARHEAEFQRLMDQLVELLQRQNLSAQPSGL